MKIEYDDRTTRREQWFDDILEGRGDRIDKGFQSAGSTGPKTLWAPRADEAQTRPIRHLIRYFDEKRGNGDAIAAARLDPADLRPALGYVNVVEPIDDGRDFRYRIFGTFIAAVTERDMTGGLLSELPASECVIDHAIASYRAVHARRLPLLSQRIPIGAKETSRWERLVLPFIGAGAEVTRLLIGIVPIGLAGLPMRPSLLSGA
ncbi:MAG: PAS domain-containing protein [Proteobacteria bacterium]|nr:PAS domain-containing protein [Pseudomonadota bacterium]